MILASKILSKHVSRAGRCYFYVHGHLASSLSLQEVPIASNATRAERIAALASWAPTYDKDAESLGYAAPRFVADCLAHHLEGYPHPAGGSEDGNFARILDYGAATGLVAERLYELGHLRIVGVDESPDMLAVAKSKLCYEDTFVADSDDYTARGKLQPSSFDAAIFVGMFTRKSLMPDELDFIIESVRPCGLISLGIMDSGSDCILEYMEVLKKTGVIWLKDESVSRPFLKNVPSSKTFRCYTFRVEPSGVRGAWGRCS